MDALLATLVLCCAALIAGCGDREFACNSRRSSNGCIPWSYVCDGDHSDCYDDSDEQNCTKREYHCADNEFACRSPRRPNTNCIPKSWVCDGDNKDCYDNSDETHCETQQQNCASDEFKCRSRRRVNGCIPKGWVCDGDHTDCYDDSDERNCGVTSTSTTTTTTTTTTLAPTTTEISEETTEVLGETSTDAVEITTQEKVPQLEESSTTTTPAPTLTTTTEAARPCPPHWLACATGSCVPPAMVCDGLLQCPDGADETQCGERDMVSREVHGDAVRLELPSWLATDQDTHFALSLAPMLRARAPRDKLDAQMAVLRLFRDLARN